MVIRRGDGEALPYVLDATFYLGFSMFGLMFFPERGKRFASSPARRRRAGAGLGPPAWAPVESLELHARPHAGPGRGRSERALACDERWRWKTWTGSRAETATAPASSGKD